MKKAKELFAEVVHLLESPPTLSLSEWTIQNRFLSSEESSIPGPYNPNFAPFQNGIMDAITDPDNERICIMASTRIGKTSIITNVIGYYASLDPCPILYMRPRADDCKNFSKQELQWLFSNTPCLADKLADNTGKESSNTLQMKVFPGGSIRLVGSNSVAALSGFAARVVLCDEVDKYEVIAGYGNPSELAEGRSTTFSHNKKIIYTSSPSIAHTPESKRKTIHSIFLNSSQTYYNIPCPHCGEYQALEWERLRFGHCRETLDSVYYQCAFCDGKITEAQKRLAMLEGKWVDTYTDKKIKGFHISQLCSPFCTFESIAEEWLAVDKSRDIYSIQRFKNEVLGLPFEDDLGLYRDSSDALYNRRERYLTEVPGGASLLTMAVDTQDSWLSYTITGWGREREAWVVKSGRIDGDPATPGPWDALAQIIYAKYRHESGQLLDIQKVLIDTRGHQTTHVNRFLKGRGPLVQGIYGASTSGKPIITKAKRDSQTGLRKWEIGTENAKTDIFSQLTISAPGPLYIHFPFELDESYFKELYSERKINGRFKVIGSRRNEKLDELAYNLAAYYICLKNYSMEQREEMLLSNINEANKPDDIDELDQNDSIIESITSEVEEKSPIINKIDTIQTFSNQNLSAKEKYLQKINGFKTQVDDFRPLNW